MRGALQFGRRWVTLDRTRGWLREQRGYTYGIASGFAGTDVPGPFRISSSVRSNVTAESLAEIARICRKVPWEPPATFHEALQALWFLHMLVMAAESYPQDLKYYKEHDWVRLEGDEAVFGITWFAQDALGEIVYADLPDVGDTVSAGASYGELESVKAVSDVFAPLSGEITDVFMTADSNRLPDSTAKPASGSIGAS